MAFTVIAVLSTVAVFAFQEAVQSALEKSVHKTHETLKSMEKTDGAEPEVAPSTDFPIVRENATMFTLCQNKDKRQIIRAIESVERQFNSRFHYDWVFLNDDEFTNEFQDAITEAVSGKAHFGLIEKKHWGYPDWIDLGKAAETRNWMREHNVVYGDLESYHHMCRFQSGFFFQHPLMQQFKYAWRVEPGISVLCKQKTDPFRLMRINDIYYGFNVAPQDIRDSIMTLWDTTKDFINEHEDYPVANNLMDFISDDGGDHYNLCHFWTNFEISNMDWLRDQKYQDYFNFLDKSGGFYYERWGDAPIRSIAASLFLPKDKVYFFNDIGYFHSPYGHCPYNQGPLELECDCHPGEGEFSNRFYDYHKNSCMRRYFKAKARAFHDENPEEKD